MAYTVVFSSDAKKDLKELQKKAPTAIPKLAKLLTEITEHPRTSVLMDIMAVRHGPGIYGFSVS